MIKPITVFISYAHKDALYLEELLNCLKSYERRKIVNVSTDKDLQPGQKWDEWIKSRIREAEIVLFLVSRDFLASDYINDIEIKQAIENSRLIPIPIIIRPIVMSQLDLNCYQVLPPHAKAIDTWSNKDDAWVEVTKALETVFLKLNAGKNSSSDDVVIDERRGNTSLVLKQVYTTHYLVTGVIVILILLSMACFTFGLFQQNAFYTFSSLAGMATGFIGYSLTRKLSSG
jgi:hypothetical protein